MNNPEEPILVITPRGNKCWTVIADVPPKDGRDWEEQCARCGSSCYYQDCQECDDGYYEDGDVLEGFRILQCHLCFGRGGWYICLSGVNWCQQHPNPGRENIPRGQIEWFTFEEIRGPE